MTSLRALVGLAGLLVLPALVAWGCSSSNDGGDPAAALVASDFRLEAPFTEIRPKVRIPMKYTCHGENLSPPLTWSGAPEGTMSYALIGEDPDNGVGLWVHWVLYNIPAGVSQLAEGVPTSTAELPDGTTQGANDHKSIGYEGPCPEPNLTTGRGVGGTNWWPEGYGLYQAEPAHKYRFTLYALDTELGLAASATKAELEKAMKGHILAQAETLGKFQLPVVSPDKQE